MCQTINKKKPAVRRVEEQAESRVRFRLITRGSLSPVCPLFFSWSKHGRQQHVAAYFIESGISKIRTMCLLASPFLSCDPSHAALRGPNPPSGNVSTT